MKIAYSTYGLQPVDPLEAVKRVKEIGYEGLELNIGNDWPTAPEKLNASARSRLTEAYQEVGFPSPVLMSSLGLCAEGENVDQKIDALSEACTLATDLNFDTSLAVVTTTLGGHSASWDDGKEGVAKQLVRYASVAADHGATIAVEPHVGHEFDSPEKAVWLVEAVDRESVKLNFDHSHFHVLGMELQRSVELCAPYSVHTHIKDGTMVDGKVQFELPGEGSLDLVAYLRALKSAGLDVPITVEVSAQIWKRDDYDAWDAAERCFGYLDDSRSQV